MGGCANCFLLVMWLSVTTVTQHLVALQTRCESVNFTSWSEVFSCVCDKTRHLKCLQSSSIIQTAVSVEAFGSLPSFFFFAKATEMILPCCCFSVSVKCSSSPLGESNDRRCSVQPGLSHLFQAQGDFFKSFKEALRMKRISSSRPRN